MNETWKDVVDFEGLYQVSDMGRVRSLDRIVWDSLRKCNLHRRGAIMKLWRDEHGYDHVSLGKNGKKYKYGVHQLVGVAFIPNPENKPEINHLYGIKNDNRPSQLEWSTHLENNQHAFRTGLNVAKKGTEHHFYGKLNLECHNSKKVKSTVTGEVLNQGMAAKKLNVSEAWFSLMVSGKRKNSTEYVRI